MEELAVDDCFNAAGFQERDDAVFAVPVAVACAPDFVGVYLTAAGQEDRGFSPASRGGSWPAGRDGIDAGGRV